MNLESARFIEALASFPPRARTLLEVLPLRGGRLSSARAGQLCDLLGTGLSGLAKRLVPVAATFSRPLVSRFRVGAVLQAAKGQEPALALGANMEFPGADVRHTLHAEQVAVSNAWLAGASRFAAISVSAEPCGHCRQFLHEVQRPGQPLVIMTPGAGDGKTFHQRPLAELLPHAFGPADLGITEGLDNTSAAAELPAGTDAPSSDPALHEALAAAVTAYAPYGGNRAGCTIVTTAGKHYAGCGMENAAYNPGLTAFQTALAGLYMTAPDAASASIERVVLVEDATTFTQRQSTLELLHALAPEAAFKYCPIVTKGCDRYS